MCNLQHNVLRASMATLKFSEGVYYCVKTNTETAVFQKRIGGRQAERVVRQHLFRPSLREPLYKRATF